MHIHTAFDPASRHMIIDPTFLAANLTFPKQQILDPSKVKDFTDDNFKFHKNGRKFFRWVENTVEKEQFLLFFHSVFKRLALHTHKNQGLFGKGLILSQIRPGFYMSAIQVFENTVGKGEIACNEQFLFFLQCFLPVWRTFWHLHRI